MKRFIVKNRPFSSQVRDADSKLPILYIEFAPRDQLSIHSEGHIVTQRPFRIDYRSHVQVHEVRKTKVGERYLGGQSARQRADKRPRISW
jgi:hypothetical protein